MEPKLPVTSTSRRMTASLLAPALALGLTLSLEASEAARQEPVAEKSSPAVNSAPKKKVSPSKKRTARRRAAARRSSFKRRMARMRVQPERVREIQQALKDAGYFEPEPHGKYDEVTKEAMRRYQADNGFPTTGLPEARTLMKLGLGPHPLPDDVDPLQIAAAQALAEPSEEAAAEEAAAVEESESESNGVVLSGDE